MIVTFWPYDAMNGNHKPKMQSVRWTAALGLSLVLWILMASIAYAQIKGPVDDPGGETPRGNGTTYYVSSSLGDDLNDGRSPASPWRSLRKVVNAQLNPGDTVLFKRDDAWGDKRFSFSSSGMSGAPITYGAYGQGQRPKILKSRGVIMKHQSWVVIDRLHFHMPDQLSLRFENSAHIIISNSEIDHFGRECLRIYKNSEHILVLNNKIHHCGLKAKGRPKREVNINGEGIYVGSYGNHSVDYTGYITLRGNEVYHTSDEGINVKENTHNILIDGNVVHDIETSDPGGISLRPVEGQNHVVRNNVIYNIVGHPEQRGSGVGLVTGEGVEVYNNMIYNNGTYGIQVMKDARVYHNTVYGNPRGNLRIKGDNAEIQNNIGTSLRGNLAASKALFVDADGQDFRLRNDSAAIDTAQRTAIMTDMVGALRPEGNGVDYGALEATSASVLAVVDLAPPSAFRLLAVRY